MSWDTGSTGKTGTNAINAAESNLEYHDGTSYKAIGGVAYDMDEASPCVRIHPGDGLTWADQGCSAQRSVLCEYNCDNINKS